MRKPVNTHDRGSGEDQAVSGDMSELRPALASDLWQPRDGRVKPFDPCRPNIARVWNRWLGGKDSHGADRAAADALAAEFPEIALVARASRQFVTRAVGHVGAQGITQYIDIGAGLPLSPAVHDVARTAQPGARVAYVDNDPVVLCHADALLAVDCGIAVVPGDVRDLDGILSSAELRAVIDLRQPVCIVLAAVLHFVTAAEADAITAAVAAAVAPGSYLIVSAGTSTGTSPALIAGLAAACQGTTAVTFRAEAEIGAWFDGLDPVPPGLVDVWAWRPVGEWYWPAPPSVRMLGAAARKADVGRGRPEAGGVSHNALRDGAGRK
jgi:O-methyltransferase involved in polyketide biosynthesis